MRPYLEYVDGYQPVSTNPKAFYNAGYWRSPFSYEERLHAAAWLTFTELVRCWADHIIIIIFPHILDCERP